MSYSDTASAGLLSRERIVAGPGFSRWMVPPAALCVHLCIGQVYAFSVFNLPMTKLIGITKSAPDDWKLTDLGWIFSIAILVLGLASFATGSWLDRVGPRKAMFTAACCFGGGFLVSAFGVWVHNLWIVYLGYGVIGGCGLGIGYISPVKTLITWFPDRPGMATGMAIMGFGGGAMIASPLSVKLMSYFSTPTHIGVAETFVGTRDHLLLLHDAGRHYRPRAAAWLASRRICRADADNRHDHDRERACGHRTAHTAILAALVGAVPERDSRHRRARSGLRHGAGDVPRADLRRRRGRLRRTAEPVQYARAVLLGLHLRPYWAQEHLLRVLPARHAALQPGAYRRAYRQHQPVRAVLPGDHQHVWRRIRDCARLSERPVRRAIRRRHSRTCFSRRGRPPACSVRCW